MKSRMASLLILAALLGCLATFPLPAEGRSIQRVGSSKLTAPAAQFAPNITAPISVQKAEKEAILALAEALGNHPIFSHGSWAEMYPKYYGIEPYPCNDTWLYLYCTNENNGRITAIVLPYTTIHTTNASWPPLTGTIPWDKLKALTYLMRVDFTGNKISGAAVPPNVEDFPFLSVIYQQGNNYTTPLPANMGKLKNLTVVDVSINYITGPIPIGLSNISYLQTLDLYTNQMTGTLPADLGNSPYLTRLDVGQNNLNGSIPSSWGALQSLNFLNLQKGSLTGTIPASFANLTSIQLMDLGTNELTGLLPEFIANWNITTLVISNNLFYGPVPPAILAKKFVSLDISYNYFNGSVASNPVLVDNNNCYDTQPAQRSASECTFFAQGLSLTNGTTSGTKSKSSSFPIIAVIIPLVIVVLVLVAFVSICLLRRRAEKKTQAMFSKNFKNTVPSFGLADLKRATKNFSQTIGKGGYGTVYKAVLRDGTIVAVKRLDQVSKQGDVEFIREVELLSRLHHRHLVNLVGFCAERGERILIYEYMAMGSLYEHIHGPAAQDYPLSWDSRTKIAIHIALGLEYLHYGADPPLIHRDIKSANILLSDEGYSKVADFGLCKEAPLGADGSDSMVPTATAVRGSFGYLDPEYVNTSLLSEKSDVYSYGVVLLELISGHKSIHDWQPLAYWAEEFLSDREKTALMVDPALEGNFDIDELYAICDIARICVQDKGVSRPTIREVAKALVESLGHTLSSYAGSTRDSASVLSSAIHSETSSVSGGSSYTPTEMSQTEMSYQNYSETLHWTPPDSGKVEPGTGTGRYPVPMPPRLAKKGGSGGGAGDATPSAFEQGPPPKGKEGGKK